MADEASLRSAKGHCPECRAERNAEIVGEYIDNYSDDEVGVWGSTNYRILRCRGCDRVYFQVCEVFSEDIDYMQDAHTGEFSAYLPERFTHYPHPIGRDVPKWSKVLIFVDKDLEGLFRDIYAALNADLYVLAAIAVRTVFDRSSDLLGVDPALKFNEKLDDLVAKGKISPNEKDGLSVLTDAGNAAAHRGWRPEPSEIDTMISLLESFLHRTFVLNDEAKRLQAKIPARPKRRPPSAH